MAPSVPEAAAEVGGNAHTSPALIISHCRHFLPAQGHRWPSDVDPSVTSCGRLHRGRGGALCSGNIMWVWLSSMSNYHDTWIIKKFVIQISGTDNKQGVLRGNSSRKPKVLLEGCSQFDATVIFINTQIPSHCASESKRVCKMKSPCSTFKGMRAVKGWFSDAGGNEKVMHLWLP